MECNYCGMILGVEEERRGCYNCESDSLQEEINNDYDSINIYDNDESEDDVDCNDDYDYVNLQCSQCGCYTELKDKNNKTVCCACQKKEKK